MISWYKNIQQILKSEPEVWLSYLHGQQLHNRIHLARDRPRYAGLSSQVAKFFGVLLRDFRLKKQVEFNCPVKFLAFLGTANQMHSLDQTIGALKERGESVIAVVNPRLLASEDHAKGYVSFQLTLTDLMRVVVLFSTRGWGVYRILKKKNPILVDWHFSTFCSVYTYLAYFYRILSRTVPEFVITANDHNVSGRCLLAVAHHLNIKTVYLQHASVSSIFPALRMNYAFLDGQCALDIYRQCEKNQPHTRRNVPVPEVVLSGQKKHLKRVENKSSHAIGIALNALDCSEAAIEFIQALTAEGLNVHLRWHPGQAPKDTQAYRDVFREDERVKLSDPRQESITVFMGQIGLLVAGNSSIHLEAALAGVMPVYYELTPPDQPDYYGYVRHGLAHLATSTERIFELVNNFQNSHCINEEAVRYYSSTYLTEWDGCEGELVAESLIRLSAGNEPPAGVISF